MPWTYSQAQPHLFTSPGYCFMFGAQLCVPPCVSFYLSVFTTVSSKLHLLTEIVCAFLSASSSCLTIYSSCASTLLHSLHKHSCKQFSEGGNNLIVWVNPKWEELQKQSSSEHLQLENMSHKETLMLWNYSYFLLFIYYLVSSRGKLATLVNMGL